MIDNQELLLVVDENNNPLKSKPRDTVHRRKLWHRTTGVWVVNSKGQVLCQKRSSKKDIKPGFWEAFFGGHVGASEDYLESAASEVNEELGLNIKPENLISYKVFKSDKSHHKEFQQVLFLRLDSDISDFNFEQSEIDELRWIDIEELKTILVEERNPSWVLKYWDGEVINQLMRI